ncbi:MAG: hypothetical protein V1918_04995 [Planctomycetota bacterium]
MPTFSPVIARSGGGPAMHAIALFILLNLVISSNEIGERPEIPHIFLQ